MGRDTVGRVSELVGGRNCRSIDAAVRAHFTSPLTSTSPAQRQSERRQRSKFYSAVIPPFRLRLDTWSKALFLELITTVDRGSRSDRPHWNATRAGLLRCRWPRPRNASRLAAPARSWWVTLETYCYGHHSILIGRRNRYSCSTHIFASTFDVDFSPWHPRRAMVMTHIQIM